MLFIATRVKEAKDKGGLEAGQAKYRDYFVKTKLYLKYKETTDEILITEGYGDCIVTQ